MIHMHVVRVFDPSGTFNAVIATSDGYREELPPEDEELPDVPEWDFNPGDLAKGCLVEDEDGGWRRGTQEECGPRDCDVPSMAEQDEACSDWCKETQTCSEGGVSGPCDDGAATGFDEVLCQPVCHCMGSVTDPGSQATTQTI